MPDTASHPPDLLGALLRDVSRSFYLTLRILPGAVRKPIGLAYLLARATDTIADTTLVPVDDRLAALAQLRDRILERNTAPLTFDRFLEGNRSSAPTATPAAVAERRLLQRLEEALQALAGLPAADQKRIREVLSTITSGQELDLQRFGALPPTAAAIPPRIIALPDTEALEDYTYRVAGCVGEFWTHLCRAHLFPAARLNDAALLANGIRFGQGLQMVNILRDLPADLRQGRCYLPEDGLRACELTPADLLNPASAPRLRPLFARLLDRTESHLRAGWTYTNALPWRCARVRLACAWPILIGRQTLNQLRTRNVLEAGQRIKIHRSEVRNIMLRTVLLYFCPPAWRRLHPRASV